MDFLVFSKSSHLFGELTPNPKIMFVIVEIKSLSIKVIIPGLEWFSVSYFLCVLEFFKRNYRSVSTGIIIIIQRITDLPRVLVNFKIVFDIFGASVGYPTITKLQKKPRESTDLAEYIFSDLFIHV